MTGTQKSVETQTATRTRSEPPHQWNVVLLNDEEHTYEYVVRMMRTLFRHSGPQALKIARTVDGQGRAVCLTTHKEHAELKAEQIHAFGRDPLMAVCKGSMSAHIEPAELGGDDSGADGHNNP